MGLLGKILALLNIVAAAAFLYLAYLDWSQRSAWSYAVLRYGVAIDGLPLDKEQHDPIENVRPASLLGPKTLKDMFQGTGEETPVQTQVEEVEQVHGRLKARLDRLEGAEARQALAGMLVPLARSGDVRDTLKHKIRDGKLEDLKGENGPLERLFKALRSDTQVFAEEPSPEDKDKPKLRFFDPFEWAFTDLPFKTLDDKKRTVADKRQAIAHLLFNLSPEDESPSRAAVVVGLQAYTDEGNNQAKALGLIALGMVPRVRQEMLSDRAAFASKYQGIVGELQALSARLKDQQGLLASLESQQGEHQALVAARTADVKNLYESLLAAREKTRTALTTLAEEQQRLFDAQGVVGKGQKNNEQLLNDIRRLEKVGP